MSTPQNLTLQQNLAIRLLRVLRYNKARTERAIALMPPAKRPLYHALPFLLHINHPDFPGYVEDPDVPFGLNNFSFRDAVRDAMLETFPAQKNLFDDIRKIWPKQKVIDSLVLMGSIGTIAQSDTSDFDYWVCVDGNSLSERKKALLQQKVSQIEHWAEHTCGMEVHFFVSEIQKVKNNDFGDADGESSGSAQAVFLKAEFYTTNIVVAGKAPFWWLMPEKTTDRQYEELIETLKGGESPDPNWFMDLGNLQRMDPGELFGAAIWQITKGMDSPFKSLLKMAKLEVFLENIDQQQPLCNALRKRVHNGTRAPGEVDYIDPYALMFDELVEHYLRAGHPEIVKLLQLCLYIKCGCKLSVAAKEGENTFKRQIIRGYVQGWGWSEEKIRKIDRIKYWSFREKSLLSRQIHSFLINCYRRMSAKMDRDSHRVSQQDMTVIGRKIEAYYAKKPNKIDYLRSVFDDELYSSSVTMLAQTPPGKPKVWTMYAGNQLSWEDDAPKELLLKSGEDPLALVTWGVWNRIIDSRTRFLMSFKTEPVTDVDLAALAKHVEQVFPPLKVSDLNRDALLAPPRLINCMVVLNFECRRTKADIDSIRIITLNSWGELSIQDGLDALQSLRFDLFDVAPAPGRYLLAPEECNKARLYDEFKRQTDMTFENEF